mmetsp:Transcript_3319/g.9432  ORF Transcript_3319/g.9432 Transcript_3319/m.9432 type:complete len:507 (+) Transcript_3319:211-1731(+)
MSSTSTAADTDTGKPKARSATSIDTGSSADVNANSKATANLPRFLLNLDVSKLRAKQQVANQRRQATRRKNGLQQSFPFRLHRMLEEIEEGGGTCEDSGKEETGQRRNEKRIISWVDGGSAFQMHDIDEFMNHIAPRYFRRQTKHRSFMRQLQLYGFARDASNHQPRSRGWRYHHPKFLKGRPNLCAQIERRVNRVDYNDNCKDADTTTAAVIPLSVPQSIAAASDDIARPNTVAANAIPVVSPKDGRQPSREFGLEGTQQVDANTSATVPELSLSKKRKQATTSPVRRTQRQRRLPLHSTTAVPVNRPVPSPVQQKDDDSGKLNIEDDGDSFSSSCSESSDEEGDSDTDTDDDDDDDNDISTNDCAPMVVHSCYNGDEEEVEAVSPNHVSSAPDVLVSSGGAMMPLSPRLSDSDFSTANASKSGGPIPIQCSSASHPRSQESTNMMQLPQKLAPSTMLILVPIVDIAKQFVSASGNVSSQPFSSTIPFPERSSSMFQPPGQHELE